MNDFIRVSEEIVTFVRSLIRKPSYQILEARLQKKATLRAKLDIETRWSSTLETLKCFCNLYDVLRNLNMPKKDYLLPDTIAHKKIDTLC